MSPFRLPSVVVMVVLLAPFVACQRITFFSAQGGEEDLVANKSTTVANNSSHVTVATTSISATVTSTVTTSATTVALSTQSTATIPLSTSAPNGSVPWTGNVSIWFIPPAIPGLVLNFVGYRYIGSTVFGVGGVAAAGAFYHFAPSIFNRTKFCCGANGTETGLIVVTTGVGIVGGLLARGLFQFGIFVIGMCLGAVLAFAILTTPLNTRKFFNTTAGVLSYYLAFILSGGVLSLVFKKLFVILTTSIGGSLLFLLVALLELLHLPFPFVYRGSSSCCSGSSCSTASSSIF
eukprot:m.148402 g.148402  ORF g.148402 m.148402 type:complete len:291 (-) comp14177_c2_seq3:553-1425(-)